MRFVKTDKVKKIEKFNIFEVEIKLMHGDADFFESIVISDINTNEEYLLEDIVNTLKLMEKEYSNGRGGGDDYNHVEGFNKWFCYDALNDDEIENLDERIDELCIDWKYSEYGQQASLYDYKIYFYDENGIKYNVSVIK